jgi:hypothetical protein
MCSKNNLFVRHIIYGIYDIVCLIFVVVVIMMSIEL